MSMKGFTLFEVLLTMFLLTFGFLALSEAMSVGLFAGGDHESHLVANNLAVEKMEELKNKTYANVASEAKAAVSGFTPFQREVAVTVPQANLKQATVTVYWYNKSDELSTSLVTYVSNI